MLAIFLLAAMPGLIPIPAAAAQQTVSIYCDGESSDEVLMTALVAAFQKANPSFKVNFTVAPKGVDTKEAVRVRLAAGKMADVFSFYSGSLFQKLAPAQNLVDLGNEPWSSRVISSFNPAVSVGPVIYGAPLGYAMGGGILYNKLVYSRLKLHIPHTWKQFMTNNALIKKAGIIPVVQTYGDDWTAQLLVLADAYNLMAAFPGFPDLYTSNRVRIAETPAALAGFRHLAEVYGTNSLNKDFRTATFGTGLKYLATGRAAHYPMLSFASTQLAEDFPKLAENIGMFAEPGISAKSNGLTIWLPNALYIPKSTSHLFAAKKFVAFAMSAPGRSVMSNAMPPTGPYMIKNAKLTGKISTITRDMFRYFNSPGKTVPALEFLTPVKGPALPKITVQVGSGILTAEEGAVAYDKDVKAESAALGLPGWGKLPG